MKKKIAPKNAWTIRPAVPFAPLIIQHFRYQLAHSNAVPAMKCGMVNRKLAMDVGALATE